MKLTRDNLALGLKIHDRLGSVGSVGQIIDSTHFRVLFEGETSLSCIFRIDSYDWQIITRDSPSPYGRHNDDDDDDDDLSSILDDVEDEDDEDEDDEDEEDDPRINNVVKLTIHNVKIGLRLQDIDGGPICTITDVVNNNIYVRWDDGDTDTYHIDDDWIIIGAPQIKKLVVAKTHHCKNCSRSSLSDTHTCWWCGENI